MVEGAIVGRNCDIRAHARIHEGVAIGDQVTIGDQSVIYPGVRIYPYKEVDYGAQIYESLIWESRGTTRVFSQDGVVGLVNVDLTPEIALRFGAALGTALEARRARGREPRERARLPDDQARAHLRPALDRRQRRRPAHAARARREAPAEDAGLRRRVPRRRVDDRSGGRADPPLRAPRHRAVRGDCRRRSRSTSRARSCAASRSATSARSRTRRGRGRAMRATCSPTLDTDAIRRARLPDRRRLRLLGGQLRASARARASGRRGGHLARVRVRHRLDPRAAGGDDRPGAAARRRGQRRLRRGLRPVGGADLSDRRAWARGAPRSGAAALPEAAQLERTVAGRSSFRSRRRARSRKWSAAASRWCGRPRRCPS